MRPIGFVSGEAKSNTLVSFQLEVRQVAGQCPPGADTSSVTTWRLHDGREVEGPRTRVAADRPGPFSEELRLLADDGSEDRDYAQLRVWNTNSGAAFAAGWFYHWPVRGARPDTPVIFWNRLFGTTGLVEIDFGDESKPVRIVREITHAYRKAGLYTAALRSRGPADEPVEARMRVVIEP